eukprot:55732_1
MVRMLTLSFFIAINILLSSAQYDWQPGNWYQGAAYTRMPKEISRAIAGYWNGSIHVIGHYDELYDTSYRGYVWLEYNMQSQAWTDGTAGYITGAGQYGSQAGSIIYKEHNINTNRKIIL